MPSPLCFGARTARAGALSPLPGHLRGLAQTPAGPPVFGDMAGGAAAPPAPSAPGSSPPPAAAPAAACSSRALGQRRRQLPEPETMLLRHPHAVPSNALQREDGRREKGSEGAEGRPRCCSAGRGRDGGDWRRVRAALPTGLPGIPPSLRRRNPRDRGRAARGRAQRGREPLPRAAQAQPPRRLSFVCSVAGLGSRRPRWTERRFGM